MTGAGLMKLTVLIAMVCASVSGAAFAQTAGYPAKPIRFVIGFPPGGSTDVAARLIAPRLTERLGQPLIMDNRAGAGGNIGVDAIAKSAPDGYTIGFGVSGALAVNVSLQPDLPYDPVKDIAPIALAVINPLVLCTAPDTPVTSVRELIGYAKSRPEKVVYATGGTGTAMHLSGAMLNRMAGIELTHIAYKGNGAAATGLVGSQVPVAIVDLTSARAFIRAGRIRALGVTSAKRTQLAPEIPTIAESGLPGFDITSWFGVIAPAGTPADIVALLNAELIAVLKDPGIRERLAAAGLEPLPGTSDEFRTLIRSEIDKYARLIKVSGIRVE
jgi:tripartite-type tricarboxylate transporter receptor subunit TctC